MLKRAAAVPIVACVACAATLVAAEPAVVTPAEAIADVVTERLGTVLERAGPFNEALTRGEDSEMTWRILSTSGPGLQIDRYIALRRCHTDGRISDDATPRSVGLM